MFARAARPLTGWLHGANLVAFVASLAVLSIIVPAYLVAGVPDVGRSQAWPLTLAVTVWAGMRLSVIWVRGEPRLFSFFFWLFVYIFMGIAPTAQLRSGELSTTTPGMDPALDVPAALILILGLACFELAAGCWQLARRRVPPAQAHTSQVHPLRSVLLGVIGSLCALYFVAKVGVGASLGSRASAFAARNAAWPDPSTRAVFYALATYPSLVAVGALAQVQRTSGGLRRVGIVALLVTGIVLLMMVVSPISSARYTFGTVAFALVAFLGVMRTKTGARITMLGTLGAFLFLFPLADAFRTESSSATRAGLLDEYLANPDYDAFWQIANAYSYVVDGLVEPGRQLLGSLLFWLPRSIWPNKPIDTGSLLAQYRGYSFENLSAPLWAELLVNGSLAAVVVGFVALGVGLAAMDRQLVPAFTTAGWWAIVGAILPVYLTILLRGSLLQATGSLAVAIACLLWVRTKPASSGSPTGAQSPPS